MRPEQTVKDCHGPLISVNPPEEVVIYSVLRGVIPKPRYLEHYLGNAPRQR